MDWAARITNIEKSETKIVITFDVLDDTTPTRVVIASNQTVELPEPIKPTMSEIKARIFAVVKAHKLAASRESELAPFVGVTVEID